MAAATIYSCAVSTLIAVAPESLPAMHRGLCDAVTRAGGVVASETDLEQAEALVWADPAAAEHFTALINRLPALKWVQLPYAGVETFTDHLDPRFTFTCAKGTYALPVAEHVIALALAGLRDLHTFVPATSWGDRTGRNLLGANVTVLGAGGITTELVRLLEPWRCNISVVRRSNDPFPGADRTFATNELRQAISAADVVVVAWALTDETAGLLDASAFAAMKHDAWLVNVGRGGHLVTDHLVAALETGTIGGAALDVTDPEPLPATHRLWQLDNCIITPHVGNTAEMGLPLLMQRVEDNVRRFLHNQELVGLVDIEAGY